MLTFSTFAVLLFCSNAAFCDVPVASEDISLIGSRDLSIINEPLKLNIPDWVRSGLARDVTNKEFDKSINYLNLIEAEPLDPGQILLDRPLELDYSKYLTLTGNQDGWGGCIGRSIIHCLSMIKEMEHPYTPDLSFWYLHNRQDQLNKSGVPGEIMTKVLIENYGLSSEASLPSDYDESISQTDSNGVVTWDYSGLVQITDAINQEASLYKIETFSNPITPDVEIIKSLLLKYGPLIGGIDSRMMLADEPSNPDIVSGTVNTNIHPSGVYLISFTRERPRSWTQEYEGAVQVNQDSLYMEGTFTHEGDPGTYAWNATRDSPLSGSTLDITGDWTMYSNGFKVYMELAQNGYQITGKIIEPQIDHSIAIVGYDESSESFRCLNSWGDTWNGDGFFDLPYSRVERSMGSVQYFINHPSDRSENAYSWTARIKVTAPYRNALRISIGADGKEPKVIWDTPNQKICVDDSSTLFIDVPLPDYAQSCWPPGGNQIQLIQSTGDNLLQQNALQQNTLQRNILQQNTLPQNARTAPASASGNNWYLLVENMGDGNAQIEEFSITKLNKNTQCHSIGKFESEVYSAKVEDLAGPVPSGGNRKVYVAGIDGLGAELALSDAINAKFQVGLEVLSQSPGKADLIGTLLQSDDPETAANAVEGAELRIFGLVKKTCVNMPDEWIQIGSGITDSEGKAVFEIDLNSDTTQSVYAAAYMTDSGKVRASSDQLNLQPVSSWILGMTQETTRPVIENPLTTGIPAVIDEEIAGGEIIGDSLNTVR